MPWYRFYDDDSNCVDLRTGELYPKHVNLIHKPMHSMSAEKARQVCDENELRMFEVDWEEEDRLETIEEEEENGIYR